MQVFKLYFKLLKKSMFSIVIYFLVFTGITVYMTLQIKSSQSTSFLEKKVPIAWVNQDENSVFVEKYKEYLNENCEFIELSSDKDAVADALFYHKVMSVITIPKDFTEDFFQGKEVLIERQNSSGSAELVSLDLTMNRYLQAAALYRDFTNDLTMEEIADKVQNDLSIKSNVSLYTEKGMNSHQLFANYANYLCYGITSILILGVGMGMMIFRSPDIKNRNLAAPLPIYKANFQLIFANWVFMAACFVGLIGAGIFICPDFAWDSQNLLLIINSFIFSICALSISYLLGVTINSRQAREAAANCISLGLCFLGGVFVSQELLGESVLNVARFIPSYWFVKANNLLGSLTNFGGHNMKEIKNAMFIELGFAVAFFAIALVVSKKKSKVTS